MRLAASFWILFSFFSTAVSSWARPSVEMYMDWLWEAKGDDIFPLVLDQPIGELNVHKALRREFHERGIDLKSWELGKYRPALMTWKEVHSPLDFWFWLFPKKAELGNEIWLFWSLGPRIHNLDLTRIPKERKVLMIFEPPTVQKQGYDPIRWEQFQTILTWDDDLVDGVKFFKYHYPVLQKRIADLIPFQKKKFCCLFSTRRASRHPKELYSERERTIRFFEDKPEEFDLYGMFWEKRKYRNWRGRVENKIEVLKNYKFNICYENMKEVRGYVTEKIFDCFAAGVVPVYWGASNIEEYIPKGCFIDRTRFADNLALYQFLKDMSEEDYNQYLEQAALFLNSEKASLFSVERFVRTVADHLEKKPSS